MSLRDRLYKATLCADLKVPLRGTLRKGTGVELTMTPEGDGIIEIDGVKHAVPKDDFILDPTGMPDVIELHEFTVVRDMRLTVVSNPEPTREIYYTMMRDATGSLYCFRLGRPDVTVGVTYLVDGEVTILSSQSRNLCISVTRIRNTDGSPLDATA